MAGDVSPVAMFQMWISAQPLTLAPADGYYSSVLIGCWVTWPEHKRQSKEGPKTSEEE